MTYYSRSENSRGEKELLSEHLKKTAKLAGEFAGVFGEGKAGEWCGIFHDAGKASSAFQNVLNKTEHSVNHEACGAFMLWGSGSSGNRLLSAVVFAHHKGLDWHIQDQLEESYKVKGSVEHGSLGRKFAVSGAEEYGAAKSFIFGEVGIPKEPPVFIQENRSHYEKLPKMLHARMLLSCLADADYTASASHEDEEIFGKIDDVPLDAERILERLEEYRSRIIASSSADKSVNRLRNSVYEDCLKAAEKPSGLFTLTSPTGTGKTLALLAFAAKHCKVRHKRRIIFVLPFLSIISQNAAIYRDICENVSESHSMCRCDESTKLFAERWSSPVIVTTSVKFFESLFRSKPTDLRFLHNISDSVIVFDEAQSLPAELSGTAVEAINSLCKMFGCTAVFSTATQPAFDLRADIDYRPTEIVSKPQALYDAAKRVSVDWRLDSATELFDIADEMSELSSVCCVVNRKDHSHKLFSLLKERCGGCFYLSTDMCKAHRDEVIKEVSERLKNGLPVRLVSTSCIEAGVDLDFEYMYRALAPLDSIVQCAGRCNRNGRGAGRMTVFIPNEEKLYPSASYEKAADIVRLMAANRSVDINDSSQIREYYRRLFEDHPEDKNELVKAINNMDFGEVERQYKLIDNAGASVLVPYEGMLGLFNELAEEAAEKGITASWIARAAPITVTSYRTDKLSELCERAMLKTPRGKVPAADRYILHDKRFYGKDSGLFFSDESSLEYII